VLLQEISSCNGRYIKQEAVWYTGKDATEDFEEIGHSNAAKDLLSKYIIGDFEVCLLFHINGKEIFYQIMRNALSLAYQHAKRRGSTRW